MTRSMTAGSPAKLILLFALPLFIGNLFQQVYNMADTFYVGQTNNPYMVAATSLILPVFNISICIAGLAGVGGGSLVSRLLGQGREDEARRVGTFSIYLGLSIAALFALAMGLFMRPILGLLGAGDAALALVRPDTERWPEFERNLSMDTSRLKAGCGVDFGDTTASFAACLHAFEKQEGGNEV